jgi:hypothetical protein
VPRLGTDAPPASIAPPVVTQPAVQEELPVMLPPGHLWVSVEPWGFLSIDGTSVGRTPAIDVPIAAGPHRLRIERDGYLPYEEDVKVEAGSELRRTGIRLEARRP